MILFVSDPSFFPVLQISSVSISLCLRCSFDKHGTIVILLLLVCTASGDSIEEGGVGDTVVDYFFENNFYYKNKYFGYFIKLELGEVSTIFN